MIPPYDIFKSDAEGPLWIEAATDLESAKERVRELLAAEACEYMIVSQTTGRRITVKPD